MVSSVSSENAAIFFNQDTEDFGNTKNNVSCLELIQFFHKNMPPENIAKCMIRLAVCEQLSDFPPICWHPFVSNFENINSCHFIKLRQNDGFFYNQPFSENKETFCSKKIFDALEDVNNIVYLSYINSNDNSEVSYSLFKFEKNDGFYRIIEYNPYQNNTDGRPYSMVKIFYASCRSHIELLIVGLLDTSLGFKDVEEGKLSHNSFFNSDDFSFLEKAHVSVGSAVSVRTSGISTLLMAFNIVSEDFISELSAMENMDDFISSEENKKHLRIKAMSRKVRLDVIGTPCKKVKVEGKNILQPGTIRSYINPEKMYSYPVIQDVDPRLEHRSLQQPYKISRMLKSGHCEAFSDNEMTAIARKVDQFLEDSNVRECYEKKYYSYGKITSKNLKNKQYDFTLGINGATAKVNIPKFTPLIFKQQYVKYDSDEHLAINSVIKSYVATHLNLYSKKNNYFLQDVEVDEEIHTEAERFRRSYSWSAPAPYSSIRDNSEKEVALWGNAWGVGGIALGFNGDSSENKEHVNHGVILYETIGENKLVTPPIAVYISLRDIEKGEELLTDYGKGYVFSQGHKGYVSTLPNN